MEEYFWQQYFENLDLIISSIKDRFNQPAFVAFLKVEQLLLNIIDKTDYENEPKYVLNISKNDLDLVQIHNSDL